MKAEFDASGHLERPSSRKPLGLGAADSLAVAPRVDPSKLGDNPILQRWVTKNQGPRRPKVLDGGPAPARVPGSPDSARNITSDFLLRRRRTPHTSPFDPLAPLSSPTGVPAETWQPGVLRDRPLAFSRFVFSAPPKAVTSPEATPSAPGSEAPSVWIEAPAPGRQDPPPVRRSAWRDWWKYLLAAVGSAAVVVAIFQSTRGLWDVASQAPIVIVHRPRALSTTQGAGNAPSSVSPVGGQPPVIPSATSSAPTPPTASTAATPAPNDFLLQGQRHLQGKRYDEARRVFEIQRASGSPVASFELGVMDFEGWGVETNYVSAANHYREAADGGYLKGAYHLAAMEMHELGGLTFGPHTEKRLIAAAEGNVTGAQVALGLLYMEGGRLPRNPAAAFKWVSKAAEGGDRIGQALLGMMYDAAVGVPQSFIDAARWYERVCAVDPVPDASLESAGLPSALKAASKDTILDAWTRLGLMRKTGRGVEKDYAAALKLLRAASDEGYAEAQFNLGLMYHNGLGTGTNYEAAVTWYRKAAEQHYASAEFNLAGMYDSGLGVTRDSTQAVVWYRRAAERGVVRAMVNLGWMYQTGRGCDVDYGEAAKWFGRAAESGDPKAQAFLGSCYSEGKGVNVDLPEAYKWLHLSSLGGNAEAESLSTALLDRLKPQEIAEALKRAREFQKRTQSVVGQN